MKVLLAISSYLPNFGGLQSVTSRLAHGLSERGCQVTVLTQRYPRSLPPVEVIDGISVRRLLFLLPRLQHLKYKRLDLFFAGFVYFPMTLLFLLWQILREKPNVVNLHFVGAPAPFLLFARKLLKFRYVVSLHGDDVEGLARGTWFDEWVFRMTLRWADQVTACSRYLLNQALALGPAVASKARVIYNSTDLDPSTAATLADQDQGRSNLVGIGRMVPKKGFDVLLRALALCAGTHLVLIGDGPERAALESLACELGLDGRVEFRGTQDHGNVMQAIARSQLVVIPSRQEPFGIVALEALATGKPVVASNVGGLPEVLVGADAILVEPDDPMALSSGIRAVLDQLAQDPAFGARNRHLAVPFSDAQMVKAYLEQYGDHLGPGEN